MDYWRVRFRFGNKEASTLKTAQLMVALRAKRVVHYNYWHGCQPDPNIIWVEIESIGPVKIMHQISTMCHDSDGSNAQVYYTQTKSISYLYRLISPTS